MAKASDPRTDVLTSRPLTRKRRRGVERTELHGDAQNRSRRGNRILANLRTGRAVLDQELPG